MRTLYSGPSQFGLVTVPVLSDHMKLVAGVLDSTALRHK